MKLLKLLITADSKLLSDRLHSIFSDISHLEIVASANNINETIDLINLCSPSVLLVAIHKLNQESLDGLRKIKDQKEELITIVLSNNVSSIYIDQWRNSGADYIFDQAFQLNKVVDVLCDLLYKEQMKTNLTEE